MGKRILVADDSVTIQRAFAMVFSVEDVSLIAARSWDEALASARQHRPDLVIADVHLGDRSGYDLCAAIKADQALAGIPVHILASNQVPFDAAKGSNAGADGHLLKPFDSVKLLEAVNKVLADRATVPAFVAPQASAPNSGAPLAVPEENTSRVQIEDVSFEDEDSYGEFSIEPTASGDPPRIEKTPPPVVQAPAPMRPSMPLASRPMPSTPPPVVLSPPPRPPVPAVSAPRPAPPIVSAPLARPAAPVVSPPVASGPAVSAPIARIAPVQAVAPPPAAPAPVTNASPTAKAMPRPSLIPGVMPPRNSDAPVPAARPPAVSAPAPAPMDFGRTMMGIPAMTGPLSVPVPVSRSEVVTARETPAVKGLGSSLFDDVGLPPAPRAPSAPAPSAAMFEPPTPAAGMPPVAPGFSDRVGDAVSAKVSDKLASKMAEISARGPEYEAIVKLSREIIEQVVWEVVPELAEVMIKEQIDRLAKR